MNPMNEVLSLVRKAFTPIRKSQPGSSNVHVPTTEWKVRKDQTMNPPINNLEATMLNAAFGQPMFPTGSPQAQPRPSQPVGAKTSPTAQKPGTIKPEGQGDKSKDSDDPGAAEPGKANPKKPTPPIKKASADEIHPTQAPEGGRRVATLAVKNGDKLLMGKRRDNNKWTTPGGHVDDGESMHDGALRELHEETGMTRLKKRHIKPLTDIHKLQDKDGKPLHVQPFVVETEKRHNTTMKNDPDGEVHRWQWVDVSKGLPQEIEDNLHVPAPYNCLMKELGLVDKDAMPEEQPGASPDGGIDGGGDNSTTGIYGQQQIISGMDWELGTNPEVDERAAHEIALSNLQDDPEFYRKKFLEMNNDEPPDETINKDTEQTEQSPFAGMGLNLDIGSGQAREPGHIGIDLYPYDHGTLVHDANLGLPFEDGSAESVHMSNTLHEMDDPKALLSEIQRVLMPGGQFHYEGPNEIYNYPEWLEPTEHQHGIAKSDEASPEWHKQVFTRVATPDAATADDSEPRIGINQYDNLPADALLAMDALGYYWSDATTSGRGNRLHGYPSQGALVQKKSSTKKAKVVGKDWITINGAHIEPDKGLGATHAATGGKGKGKDKGKGKGEASHSGHGHAQHSGAGHASHGGHGLGGMLAEGLEQLGERAEKSATVKKKALVKKEFVPIMKMNKAKQIVYGVVLSPDELDQQDDLMTADDIEQTAHQYLEKSRVVGSGHEKPIAAYPVESYIAPQDIEWTDSQYGPQKITKGAWVLGVKVVDPKEWQKVITGDYAGFSVGGMGLRDPLN